MTVKMYKPEDERYNNISKDFMFYRAMLRFATKHAEGKIGNGEYKVGTMQQRGVEELIYNIQGAIVRINDSNQIVMISSRDIDKELIERAKFRLEQILEIKFKEATY